MISLSLAWRSVRRNLRRSAMVASAAAIAGLVLTIAAAFISGTAADMRSSIINGGVGDFQIAKKNAFDGYSENQLDNAMSPTQVKIIARWAAQYKNVKAWAPRLNFGGLISNGPRTVSFGGTGIDPRIENKAFKNSLDLVAGKLLTAASSEDSVVIGKGIAGQLHLKPGSTATLLTTTQSGAMNAVDVVVRGVVTTGSIQGDNVYLQTPLSNAQYLMSTDRISKIAVLAESDADTASLLNAARAISPDLEVRDWKQLTPIYAQVVAMYGGIFMFFGITLGLVTAFTIAGAVLTSVLERTSEIGLMRSLAIKRSTIRAMFSFEGALLGFIGSVAGIVVGIGLVMILNKLHLTMPPPPGATEGYPLHLLWKPAMSINLVIVFVLLAMLAAWIVSRRTSKLTILESFAKE